MADNAKATNYKRQFNAQNYDRIELTVKKGEKAAIKAHAIQNGETLNGFINRAISETIERDNEVKSAPVPNTEATQKEHHRTPKPRVRKEMSTEQLLELTKRLKAEKDGKADEKMQTIQEVISYTAEQEESGE